MVRASLRRLFPGGPSPSSAFPTEGRVSIRESIRMFDVMGAHLEVDRRDSGRRVGSLRGPLTFEGLVKGTGNLAPSLDSDEMNCGNTMT